MPEPITREQELAARELVRLARIAEQQLAEERPANEAVTLAAKFLHTHKEAAANLIQQTRSGWVSSVALEIWERITEADVYALCYEKLDEMHDAAAAVESAINDNS